MGWQWFGHFLFPNHASPCGVSSKGENTEHQTQIRTSNSLHQNVFLFTMKLQLFTNCFTLAVVWFPNPEHLLVRLGIKMKVINMSEEIIEEIFVCFLSIVLVCQVGWLLFSTLVVSDVILWDRPCVRPGFSSAQTHARCRAQSVGRVFYMKLHFWDEEMWHCRERVRERGWERESGTWQEAAGGKWSLIKSPGFLPHFLGRAGSLTAPIWEVALMSFSDWWGTCALIKKTDFSFSVTMLL